jgi:hypothetical protein
MQLITKQGAFDNDVMGQVNDNFLSALLALGLGTPVTYTAAGAIAINQSQSVRILKTTGALAMTLAAPVAGVPIYSASGVNTGGQDGEVLLIWSTDAEAHTVTATGLLLTGAAAVNEATFSGTGGGALALMAVAGKWLVLFENQISFS